MDNPSKYAFTPIDPAGLKGKKLDFAKAREILANHITEEKVTAYYKAQQDVKAVDKLTPYTELSDHRKKMTKWNVACEIILAGLSTGSLTALVNDPETQGQVCAVPIFYWRQPSLWTPFHSQLKLQSSDWKPYSRFHDLNFYLQQNDIKTIAAAIPQGSRGPRPKYDLHGCEARIKQMFEEHGPLSPGAPGWSCLADVERAIAEYFSEINPEQEPSPSSCRRYGHKFIDQFQSGKEIISE